MIEFDRLRSEGARRVRAVVASSRALVRRHLTDRATSAEQAGPNEQGWRRHQLRQIIVLVTLPGVLLGTATVAGAYGSGLMSRDSGPSCDPVTVAAPARSSYSISVLNASGINGAANDVGKQLTRRGFHVVEMTTAPRELYVAGPVAIYHGRQGLDQALLTAQQVRGAELTDDGRGGTSVALVIGASYDGLLPAPPPAPPKASQVTVNVYNTTYRDGLASQVQGQLRTRGFKAGKVGNDPDGAFLPKEVAVIRYGEDGDLAAKLLAQHVPGATLTKVSRVGTSLDLVLGNGYAALAPVASIPVPPKPAPQPPATVVRPCVG